MPPSGPLYGADLIRFAREHPAWAVSRGLEGQGYAARRRDPHRPTTLGRPWAADDLDELHRIIAFLDAPGESATG